MTYIVEYTSFSGKSIPMMHKVFKSADAANTYAVNNVTNNYKSYTLKQISEGYKIMPPMDPKYVERKGLEGPFTTLSGKVVYYDPKEGSYYDPDTDMYMSYDEFQNYDKDYSDMKDERDEVKESVGALRQIVADKNAAKVHGILVDLFTASAIMQVYDAVNDANKEKMDTMLNTKAGLMKMADFAMTKVNEAEGDWSKDSGWQDYKGQKKDPYGNTIKDKNLAKRMAKAAKKQSAETDIDENQAYRDARLTTIQTNRTNRLNQIQQNRDDRKAELKTSRDARSIKNRAALDSLKETLSPEEKRLVSQMYNKDGTLTALGKKVMDHGKTKTNEAEERPYVCVHAKKGKHECTAPTSYEAAKKAAAHWKLKSTSGIDAHLADVEHVAESVADEAVHMERDHEVQMARSDLYKIANYAVKLHKMLKNVSEEQGIQGWMQAKITKSADYMSSVAHTLEYDMMEKHQSEPMAEGLEKVNEAKAKPQQNLMAKTKALGKITKALSKKTANEMTSAGGVAAVAAPMTKRKKK
jgi:hypothetical protein